MANLTENTNYVWVDGDVCIRSPRSDPNDRSGDIGAAAHWTVKRKWRR